MRSRPYLYRVSGRRAQGKNSIQFNFLLVSEEKFVWGNKVQRNQTFCCTPTCPSPASSRLQSATPQVLHIIHMIASLFKHELPIHLCQSVPLYPVTLFQRAYLSPSSQCASIILINLLQVFIILSLTMSAPGTMYLCIIVCSFVQLEPIDISHRDLYLVQVHVYKYSLWIFIRIYLQFLSQTLNAFGGVPRQPFFCVCSPHCFVIGVYIL